MSRRDYPRLSIEEFGHLLITTGDLDPVYIALHGVRGQWAEGQIFRWLIAYWCLYHCGAASWLSERRGIDFWDGMSVAANQLRPTPFGGRWPRGHERRHFRGQQANDAVHELRARYGENPEQMVQHIIGGTRRTQSVLFQDVAQRVKEHRGFGPWIAFKVADMVDRCLGVPVCFDNAAVFMFKDPMEAALRVWRAKTGAPEYVVPKDAAPIIQAVVEHLQGELGEHTAPPLHDRPVNIQEIETVLCKWKSHMNGHYPLWNDIDEINAGLGLWAPHSQAARQFAAAMPRRGEA